MGKIEPKQRYRLNQKQLALLHLIYRFRFVTTELVAQYQGRKSADIVRPRLTALAEMGYIGRKYDPSYKLQGKHAAFYLLPDGMRALRRQPREGYEYSQKVLHNIHKDKDASDQFIEHNLEILKAYAKLRELYGDRLQFFTKSDLSIYEHFPQPLPDAYIRIEEGAGDKQYFLDVHHEARPFFISSRRIKQYADYADSQQWELTETDLPEILALCDSTTLQLRLQKKLAKNPHPKLNFLLTSMQALLQAGNDARVWQRADDPDDIKSLDYVTA